MDIFIPRSIPHRAKTTPQRNTTDTRAARMSASGRNDAGSDETSDAKIERLATEIKELKASLIEVPELSGEWIQIKTDIKDRDVERLVLLEKKRCDEVVKQYFEENPHVPEAVPECPICLEKMWVRSVTVRYLCCGKQICSKCDSQGGDAMYTCPLCRGEAPTSMDKTVSITKEKADSGIAWALEEMGNNYLHGLYGVPTDVEKAFKLFRKAADKGSAVAKGPLGYGYLEIENYEEARRCFEAAAAEGHIYSLFHLGMMIKNGQAFDRNEENRAKAFRMITIYATLHPDSAIEEAVELSLFFLASPPVMLHYLRPAVEGGSASLIAMDHYALGLIYLAEDYYGEDVIFVPGHSPVPEALFWHRQYSREEDSAVDHPLVRLERVIRERCAHCHADLPEGKRSCCVECKAAYYCNRDCQVAHWKAGHKKDCVKKLKKRLRAEGKLGEEK